MPDQMQSSAKINLALKTEISHPFIYSALYAFAKLK